MVSESIKNDGSLWYWGQATFNDTAGDQSPLRASPTKIMDDVIRDSIIPKS